MYLKTTELEIWKNIQNYLKCKISAYIKLQEKKDMNLNVFSLKHAEISFYLYFICITIRMAFCINDYKSNDYYKYSLDI